MIGYFWKKLFLSTFMFRLLTGVCMIAVAQAVQEPTESHHHENPAQLAEDIGLISFLVLFAGLMSGLSVGLMSIDPLKLELLLRTGTQAVVERDMVEKVKPVLEKTHELLVTLLVANASAMEALPLVFAKTGMAEWLSLVLSVTLVLLFGEIIPQALCTHNPLLIGARFAWIVKVLMFCLYPIQKPIALLLDYLLGEEGGNHLLFQRKELREIVALHHEDREALEAGDHHGKKKATLTHDEVTIIHGALQLKDKTVQTAITPLEECFMLEFDQVLDKTLIAKILGQGHSRIPVYKNDIHNLVGLLIVKNLISYNPELKRPAGHFSTRIPLVFHPTMSLYDAINTFQTGKSHLAIVTRDDSALRDRLNEKEIQKYGVATVIGLITLEDVIEELLQEEIEDESDKMDHKLERYSTMDHLVSGTVIEAFKRFERLGKKRRRRLQFAAMRVEKNTLKKANESSNNFRVIEKNSSAQNAYNFHTVGKVGSLNSPRNQSEPNIDEDVNELSGLLK